jgi:hypothetical protein
VSDTCPSEAVRLVARTTLSQTLPTVVEDEAALLKIAAVLRHASKQGDGAASASTESQMAVALVERPEPEVAAA